MTLPRAKIRVLYAEDNPLDADQTRYHFAENEPDFELVIVDSGQACLEEMQEHPYDLLLLDQRLPDVDGLDLLKNLIHNGIRIPVVFVTGAGDDELVVQALRLGAANYIPKTGDYLESTPELLRAVLAGQHQEQPKHLPGTALQRKILHVAHRQADIDDTRLFFAEHAPHLKLETASSSAAALEHLHQPRSFDLAVIDLNLPGESGLALVRELIRRQAGLPVVILSGQGDDTQALAALQLGVNDYITKNHGYLNKLIFSIEKVIIHDELKRANERLQIELAERKRAEDTLRRRAEEFAALYETTSDLAARQDLPALLDTIIERARKLLSAPYGAVDLYDPAREEMVLAISKGLEIQVGGRIKMGEGLTGRVAQTRKPMVIDDYLAWEHCLPDYASHPFGAFCQVPMLFGGELIGTLTLAEIRPSTRKFTEENVHFLSLLAGQAASAVYDARMLEETRHRLSELEAVNKISTALRVAHTVDEILPLLIDETLAILGTTAGMLCLYDSLNNSLLQQIARGWFENIAAENLAITTGLPQRILSSGKPYLTRDFQGDALALQELGAHIPAGWGGACLPIQSTEVSVGVFFVAVPLPRELSPEDIRLLTTLAEIAGNAIHRMSLHAKTEQRLERLAALHVVDLALSASLDVRVILGALLDQLIAQLHIDAADILLYKPLTQSLEYTLGRGFRTRAIEQSRLRMDDAQAGRAILERRIVSVTNLPEAAKDFSRARQLGGEGFFAYFTVPLTAKGQIKGVLELFHRAPLAADTEWLEFLETLGNQAAIAIDNAELFQGLERSNIELGLAYDATIEGWSSALDLRDRETEGHTQRVTRMTERLGHALGLSPEQMIHIRRGALLHDMGKLGVPDNILLKNSSLNEEEWAVMRQHPQFAYDMFSKIAYLKNALEIPYCHHEKWDGSGYPRGLKGEQIPLAARLFAVVDIWDALRFDRPYRPAWPEEKVLDYIRGLAGTHLDPQIVELFLQVVREGPDEFQP
jgi:response regulator RpfG family c-di-GMP phosphodiesterase